MDDKMACAWCVYGFNSAASIIVFRPPLVNDLWPEPIMIRERGGDGVLRAKALWNEYPKGTLDINQTRITDWTPITQVGGTLVCAEHLYYEMDYNRRR